MGTEETPGTEEILAEITELEAALAAVAPRGDILELACGTGIWTQRLAGADTRVTAVDAAPEVHRTEEFFIHGTARLAQPRSDS